MSFVELLVDTGATEHVCGPRDFTYAALTSGPRQALKTLTGELLKYKGKELRVGFTVVDVKRPILSVSRLMDRGIERFIQLLSRVCADLTVRLNSHFAVVLSFCNVKSLCRCCWHLWMMSQLGEVLDLPPVDKEMERVLMGREVVPPPVAIEVLALANH